MQVKRWGHSKTLPVVNKLVLLLLRARPLALFEGWGVLNMAVGACLNPLAPLYPLAALDPLVPEPPSETLTI